MGTQIVRSLPEAQWQAFVEAHPMGNVFHTPEMLQVFQHARGYAPELWAAVEADEILALLTPVHISLRKGILRRFSTRTVVYGSVLSTPGQRGTQAMRQLLQEYKASSGRQSLFTEMRNISPMEDLLPQLEAEGFGYEDHLNYLIDLDRPAEDVFQAIGKRTRKNIKKGLNKERVTIQEVESESDLATSYELLKSTYRAAHVPLSDYSMFLAAFRLLRPRGMIRIMLARIDEAAAAASFELLYKRVLYGWYGGMDRRWAAYVPNELLMWEILKWGAENGYKQYDFGGAGKPDEKYGVRDFKAKFGGELVCYGRNTWVPNKALMSVISVVYEVVRRVIY